MTRRDFLKSSISAAALLMSPPSVLLAAVEKSSPKSRKRVIVIGAGLAGLSCAYELSQRGLQVEIVEARDRAGGRVETLRDGWFSPPLFAESGAFWINEEHPHTMAYINELGLQRELVPLAPKHKKLLYHIKNERVMTSWGPGDPWPNSLGSEPRARGLGGIMGTTFCHTDLLRDSHSKDWPQADVIEKYGKMTFKDFVDSSHPAGDGTYRPSEGGKALIRPILAWWDEFNNVSALELIRDGISAQRLCNPLENKTKWFTLKAGMDSFPDSFVNRLAERGITIRFKSPVVGIMENNSSVTAIYEAEGQNQQQLSGDYLVCAIPFSTLKEIEPLPMFSQGKKKVIEQIKYASVTRVYVQCEKGIKAMENCSGFTDLSIGNLLDMTFNQGEENRGRILQGFMVGQQARDVAAMTDADRTKFVLEQMTTVFPELRETRVQVIKHKSWDQDPWARGAYPYFTPEQFVEMREHIASREGRIFFAGEHTSTYSSWMEGALQSGKRVAEEILAAAE